MKRKIVVLFGLLLIACLVACSEDDKTTKPDYTVEEAVNDGHVVVKHLGEDIDKVIRDGKLETKQLKKIFEFKKKVDQGKKSEVKITIFNKNGTYATSNLSFNGKKYVFKNNYTGYKAPEGTFTCDYFTLIRGTAGLQMCKSKDGKQLNRMTVLVSEIDKFRELVQEILP